MTFSPDLKHGDTVTNSDIVNIFKCSGQGGMRRSHEKKSLILISNQLANIYQDRWEGDILHFTGMGLKGDQSIINRQNKTLAESATNGVTVFLFEVLETRVYIFRGEVILASKPYQEKQQDDIGSLRKVWVFPLKLKTENGGELPTETILNAEHIKHQKAAGLSVEQLRFKMNHSKIGGMRRGEATIYLRNPYVAALAKRLAKGRCRLCDEPAPFTDNQGQPFLEVHHIVRLADGGPDTIINTVALCPNCHRKMHCINHTADVEQLIEVAKTQAE